MSWKGVSHSVSRRDFVKLLAAAGFGTVTARIWAAPRFDADPFALGVAAGDPAPDGFVIWTRLAPRPLDEHGGMPAAAVPVRWEVAEDAAFRRIVRSGEALARPELGHAVHVEVAGLRARRPHWYRFSVDGAGSSRIGMARTAPAPGARVDRLRIGVAGCQHYEAGYYDAYRHLALEDGLDAVFHYGDYIYEGGAGAGSSSFLRPGGKIVVRQHVGAELYSLDDYRRRYAQYKSDPHLQAAHASAAFVSSFDDHEVDNNWAGPLDQDGVPAELFLLRRRAALQAWYEHMPVRRALLPRADGIEAYRRLAYGDLLQMHVLDTRSHRGAQPCDSAGRTQCHPATDPGSTMLGADQEAWLQHGLELPARWHLIAQQVMVMPLAKRTAGGDPAAPGIDTWSGYPAARERLVRTLDRRGLGNVVVATGDGHLHYAGNLPLDAARMEGRAVAAEFQCTSITSGGDGAASLPFLEQVKSDNPHVRFGNAQRGYLVFDVTPAQWEARIKVMDRVETPGGSISTAATAVVLPGRPGIAHV